MIYLFYGTDTLKARTKARALIDALLKKKPDASYFKHTEDTLNEASLEELIQGQGLFERKYIIYMDTILEDAEKKTLILERIEALKESDNIFVFLEKSFDAKTRKILEKHAADIKEYEEREEKGQEFNVFEMTNALSAGNSRKAWMIFDEARRKETKAEAIHGVLWWYAKKNLGKNSSKDLETLDKMIEMYHEAHRGNADLMIELEKFVLKNK
jgi:DNA polymerase III delta subunit